jgi:hypothetical protein
MPAATDLGSGVDLRREVDILSFDWTTLELMSIDMHEAFKARKNRFGDGRHIDQI